MARSFSHFPNPSETPHTSASAMFPAFMPNEDSYVTPLWTEAAREAMGEYDWDRVKQFGLHPCPASLCGSLRHPEEMMLHLESHHPTTKFVNRPGPLNPVITWPLSDHLRYWNLVVYHAHGLKFVVKLQRSRDDHLMIWVTVVGGPDVASHFRVEITIRSPVHGNTITGSYPMYSSALHAEMIAPTTFSLSPHQVRLFENKHLSPQDRQQGHTSTLKVQLKITRVIKQEIADTVVTTSAGSHLPVQMGRPREGGPDQARFEANPMTDARDGSREGIRVEAGTSQRVAEPQVVLKEEPGRLKFD